MTRNELIKLRKLVNMEKERRQRINNLLRNNLVKEYLKLTDTKVIDIDKDNIKEILIEIIKKFQISETNKIYVCTQSYYVDCRCIYQDTDWYTRNVDINSKYAEHKTYKDIESGNSIYAVNVKNDTYKRVFIDEFEKENIVLNPTNDYKNENGYNDVRLDFFKNLLNNSQEKSKQMVLKKYPRI